MLIKNSVENSSKVYYFSLFRLGVWHCVDFYNVQDVLYLIDIFFFYWKQIYHVLLIFWHLYNLLQMKFDERFGLTRIHQFRLREYPVKKKKKKKMKWNFIEFSSRIYLKTVVF